MSKGYTIWSLDRDRMLSLDMVSILTSTSECVRC